MTLFQRNTEPLHSGGSSWWRIDCDALTVEDVEVLAGLMAERAGPYGAVEGVPRGGLRLAAVLALSITEGSDRLLIVDDVLTSGASMEEQRAGRPAVGAVAFARGPVPSWVTAVFMLSGQASTAVPDPEPYLEIDGVRYNTIATADATPQGPSSEDVGLG